MVVLTQQQAQVKAIVYDADRSYADAADWLKMAVGTVVAHAGAIRAKYKAAGQPLPDKRKHFVTKFDA